jgi:anti-sigma factor RsiW
MTDAMQAYRLFAQQGILPADYRVSDDGDMQGWLDRYFTQANRLPDLSGAGFKPASGRLLTTDQGPAAMVVYEDQGGHKISFYVRPPGPKNFMLPRGSRRDGELQAEYWSGGGYNYAMVSPTDTPAAQMLKQTAQF